MVDEQTILAAERLRDELTDIRNELRERYRSATAQVTREELRKRTAGVAETWLVELAPDDDAAAAIGSETLANLSVHFQRLLTFTEHATSRAKYDSEIKVILGDFTMAVVLPLKKTRGAARAARVPMIGSLAGNSGTTILSAFVGQSFNAADERINECVAGILGSIGVSVVTGERPKADTISSKVKRLIDEQQIFVGIFTRRDKIARKPEWTTSAWVIDEKAYALGKQKPLVLLKEIGVGSIGGIQGDYEYIEFDRDSLDQLAMKLLQLFDVRNVGFRK